MTGHSQSGGGCQVLSGRASVLKLQGTYVRVVTFREHRLAQDSEFHRVHEPPVRWGVRGVGVCEGRRGGIAPPRWLLQCGVW